MASSDGFAATLEKAVACRDRLSSSEVVSLLTPPGPIEEMMLWRTAHSRRVATMGACVHMRAIIEFSNYCRQDCLYCGLRRSNDRIARYRMTPDEIVDAAREAHSIHPFGTFVLQSGEDPGYSLDDLAVAVRKVVDTTGAAVTLSIGEMSSENYRILRDAGADRFLLKFETSDAPLFRWLKPTTSLAHRLGCLNSLREMGYQIGSGIIIGFPGQGHASVADDLLLCRDEDYEMVSIGPFIPHPDTPLSSMDDCGVDFCSDKAAVVHRELPGMEAIASSMAPMATMAPMAPVAPMAPMATGTAIPDVCSTINAVAVARLLVPCAHMPATTALGVIGKNDESWREIALSTQRLADARSLALAAGANVLMLDVTPRRYREFYTIYPGKSGADGNVIADSVGQAKEDIHSLDMTICPGRGDSPKMPWGRGDTGVGR